MRKGQGSLEYLLILAAILAIAVVVVVVANSMLAPGQEAGAVAQDKYNCGVVGIELKGYTKQPIILGTYGSTDGSARSLKVVYQGVGGAGGVECSDATVYDSTNSDAQCSFGDTDQFKVFVKKTAVDMVACTITEVTATP